MFFLYDPQSSTMSIGCDVSKCSIQYTYNKHLLSTLTSKCSNDKSQKFIM